MEKTCPICGAKFQTYDLRKTYCSQQCARVARYRDNVRRQASRNTGKRMEWARQEAMKIRNDIADATMDELANYIYNNYNKRNKR